MVTITIIQYTKCKLDDISFITLGQELTSYIVALTKSSLLVSAAPQHFSRMTLSRVILSRTALSRMTLSKVILSRLTNCRMTHCRITLRRQTLSRMMLSWMTYLRMTLSEVTLWRMTIGRMTLSRQTQKDVHYNTDIPWIQNPITLLGVNLLTLFLSLYVS